MGAVGSIVISVLWECTCMYHTRHTHGDLLLSTFQHTCICTDVCVYIYMYMYVYVRVHLHVPVYVKWNIHVHVHYI